MESRFTLDDAINLLSSKRVSLSEEEVDKILHQLIYQKEINLVYTESVSRLVDKITKLKMEG